MTWAKAVSGLVTTPTVYQYTFDSRPEERLRFGFDFRLVQWERGFFSDALPKRGLQIAWALADHGEGRRPSRAAKLLTLGIGMFLCFMTTGSEHNLGRRSDEMVEIGVKRRALSGGWASRYHKEDSTDIGCKGIRGGRGGGDNWEGSLG